MPARDGWTLSGLLDEAEQRARGPVLVALDLVLGVPAGYFGRRVEIAGWESSSTFVQWLPRAAAIPRFFEPVSCAREWSVRRPFFSVPGGRGALRAFAEVAGFDLRREVDRRCRGKPVFAVSGIPGSVGSASRAFWREIAPSLGANRPFRVWPFEGELHRLLRTAPVVLAETYPRIAYGIAVAPEISARLRAPSKKGDRTVRREWICRLQGAPWLRRFGVTVADQASALASEDDFDALFAAAALLRCALAKVPLASRTVDRRAEGGILGMGVMDKPSPGESEKGVGQP